MSLGSRLAKRGRAAINASLTPAPREPLLFLYPAWIRTSSSTPPLLSLDEPPPKPIEHAEIGSDTWQPATTPIQRKLRIKAAVENLLKAHESAQEDLQHEVDGQDTTAEGVAGVPLGPIVRRVEIVKPSAYLNPPNPRVTELGHWRRVFARRESHILSVEKHRAHRAILYQKRRVARSSDTWIADWRVILSDLSNNTPKHGKWLEKAVNILIPESAMARLLYGVDDNMFDLGKRHGCVIELSPKDNEGGQNRSVVISGSKTAITMAATDILRIAPEAKLTLEGTTPTSLEMGITTTILGPIITEEAQMGRHDGSLRFVMAKRPIQVPVTRVDKTPLPAVLTQESFADHIEALTKIRTPSHLHRLLMDGGGRSTSRQKLEALERIFHDPAYASVLSRTAFNTALEFCVSKNQMAIFRQLFSRMDTMKIAMNVDTFNIMLRGCAHIEDLHNFHFIMHMMLRRGISPNAETWRIFMWAAHDLRIKLHILNNMKERGLLHHIGSIRSVVEHLVTSEIEASLDNGYKQDVFLKHMDIRYGPHWLSVNSGRRVIHALASRQLISCCWDFLWVMLSRPNCKPNQACIHTILWFLKVDKNISGVVTFLSHLPPVIGFVHDQKTYKILFQMAIYGRHYNLARVVWKYACLEGATTDWMRSRVQTSLKETWLKWWFSKKSIGKHHQRQSFNANVGYFVTAPPECAMHPIYQYRAAFEAAYGPGARDEQFPSPHETAPFIELKDLEKIDIWRRSQQARDRGEEIVSNLDCNVFQYFRPKVPLVDKLLEAWEIDKKWEAADLTWTWVDIMSANDPVAIPIRTMGPQLVLETEWK